MVEVNFQCESVYLYKFAASSDYNETFPSYNLYNKFSNKAKTQCNPYQSTKFYYNDFSKFYTKLAYNYPYLNFPNLIFKFLVIDQNYSLLTYKKD